MVQRNCWILKSSKVRAFTLLESLLALIVISGGLLLFQAMSQLLISEVRYQQQSEQKPTYCILTSFLITVHLYLFK